KGKAIAEVAIDDPDGDQLGPLYLTINKHTFSSIKVKFESFEIKVHELEQKLASFGRSKVPAVHKLRCLAVGWDIRQHADPAGRRVITLDPCVTKTSHRQDQSERSEDPGKFLHPKVERLYKEYLLKWRPVLMDNLGARAKHDVTYNDIEHGLNAGKCTTLFPGFWPDGQHQAFVRGTFLKAMGCGERKVRKAWSKQIGENECWDWEVNLDAAYQHFHRSREIHETVYRQGFATV
ncbi:unnamed protein product, partial [Polarella glacialis]